MIIEQLESTYSNAMAEAVDAANGESTDDANGTLSKALDAADDLILALTTERKSRNADQIPTSVMVDGLACEVRSAIYVLPNYGNILPRWLCVVAAGKTQVGELSTYYVCKVTTWLDGSHSVERSPSYSRPLILRDAQKALFKLACDVWA